MGNLPNARTETCLNGGLVNPNLINEIQDVIISEHTARTNTQTVTMHGVALIGTGLTYGADGVSGNGPINAFVSVDLDIGATVTAVRAFIKDAGAGPTKFQVTLESVDNTGVTAAIASSAVSSGAGTDQTLSIAGLTTVVASNLPLAIKIATTTGTDLVRIRGLEIDYLPTP